MTKEELAAQLNGREYREEMTKAEELEAKANALVVVFGYSDDNVEFRGDITDEIGCGENSKLLVDRNGVFRDDHECDCEYCGFQERKDNAKVIQTLWSQGGYSWQYKTDIPHATFDVMEDGEKYCRGIVFSTEELCVIPSFKGRGETGEIRI